MSLCPALALNPLWWLSQAQTPKRNGPDDKDLDGFVAKLRLLKTPKEVDDLAENDVFNSVKAITKNS